MTTTATTNVTFRWKCSYQGTVWFDVYGDGPRYEIETRRSASDYERQHFSGTEAEWQRDVIAGINLLRRSCESWLAIPAHVVAAFNVWRAAEHAANVRQITSQPERYGEIDPADPLFTPPPVVRGARYQVGTGWIENPPADQLAA